MPPQTNQHDHAGQDVFELLSIVAQDVVQRALHPGSTLGPKALRKYIATMTTEQLKACQVFLSGHQDQMAALEGDSLSVIINQEDEANNIVVNSAVHCFTSSLSCHVDTKVPVEKQGCLDVVSNNVTHLVVCTSHWAILDRVQTVAACEVASCPNGRAGAAATGSEGDLTCPPIS